MLKFNSKEMSNAFDRYYKVCYLMKIQLSQELGISISEFNRIEILRKIFRAK